MNPRTTPLILVLLLAAVASACSSGDDAATTTAPTVAPATTAATTTSSSTTSSSTTEPLPTTLTFTGKVPKGIQEQAEAFYAFLADPSNPVPEGTPAGLEAHVASYTVEPGVARATGSVEVLANGDRVGVFATGDDVLLFTDTGQGWQISGAMLEGLDPWLGDESPRTLLVLGSDARVGEDQLYLRADSVHVLTMVPETGEGVFLGFPRDSWVRGSKLTDLMPRGGPELMVEVIEEVTSLEMEGWVAVGFEGFLGLMTELGPLDIDLPTVMRSGNTWQDYPEGPQTLDATLTLRLARIRKGLPAGDFDRTYNQGLILLAAMTMIQDMGIEELPRWVAAFDRHGFTDLETEALLTWAATAYVATPDTLVNYVVPGGTGAVGAASVVFISDSAESVFRDLDDGVLDEQE